MAVMLQGGPCGRWVFARRGALLQMAVTLLEAAPAAE